MIKAMIFDMDGVLFDTERVLKDCWIKTAKEMNFFIGEEELRQMRGASAAFCNTLFQKWYEGKVDYKKARARRSQYLEEYIDLHSIPEKKGLKELLNYLKQQNIPFAIATSTERKRASEYWEMAKITDLISASVCGDEVTNSKPDPEIFLTAAKKTSCSHPGLYDSRRQHQWLKSSQSLWSFFLHGAGSHPLFRRSKTHL